MTESEPRLRDYVAWHDDYRNPASALSARLRQVQASIIAWYDAHPGEVRVLSSCAGQGDDILGVLAARPDLAARTTAVLLEILPENVAVAQERAAAIGARIEVRQADASVTDAYAGAVPADLVLLSGIMGNISAADIQRLIATSRQFCAPGGTVIWTRGNQNPDLGPQIRGWFEAAGFESTALHEAVEGTRMRVGVERLAVPAQPLQPGISLFTFYR